MIEAKDRPLFEALCVAYATMRRFSDGAALKKDNVVRQAQEALLAIRAAEGPGEAKPVAPGDLDLLWLEGECKSLRELLAASHVSADARAHEAYRNGFADGARLTAGDYSELVDQSEAIIHALCDDRARARTILYDALDAASNAVTLALDDPAGATDEDELTDVERRVYEAFGTGWFGVASLARLSAVESWEYTCRAIQSLRSLGLVEESNGGWKRAPRAPHVLPIGHVPGPGGLRVGMVLDFYGRSRLKVASLAGDICNFEGEIFTNVRFAEQMSLAEPFTVPAESTKTPKVLPIGHAPERLEVGMVVTWNCISPETRTITRIVGETAFGATSPHETDWVVSNVHNSRQDVEITLAAPYTVTGDQ